MEEKPSQREPEVYFCDLCQESIPEKDLAQGKALEIQGRRVCARCRARMVPPLPSARWAAVLALLAFLAAGAAAGLSLIQGKDLAQRIRSQEEALLSLDGRVRTDLEVWSRILGEIRRALGIQEKRLAGLEDGGKETLRRSRDLASSLAALKKDFFDFRTLLQGRLLQVLDGRLLNLAERFSALEAAVKKQADSLEKALGGLEDLSRRVETGSGSSRAVPPGPSLPPRPSPGGPKGKEIARLAKLLESPEADQRWKAVEALERIPSHEAVQLVARALRDRDIWVRRLAAEVLGRMGRMEAVGYLIRALSDPEAMIRAAAAASLRSLTGKTLGYDPNGSPAERKRSMAEWEAWWARKRAEAKKKTPKG